MYRGVVEKIYKIFNYTQHVDQTDPDIYYIKKELARLPAESVMDFYAHLVSSEVYYTQGRVLSRDMLPRAVTDFLREKKEKTYKELKIGERAAVLAGKLSAVAEGLKERTEAEQNSYLDQATKKLEAFKMTREGRSQSLFDAEEKSLLEETGLRDPIRMILDMKPSEHEYVQYIEQLLIQNTEAKREVPAPVPRQDRKKRISLLDE